MAKKKITAGEIDILGGLLADIAELSRQADEIKGRLKLSGLDSLEGDLFNATVVHQERVTLDSAKVRTLLGKKASLVEKVSPTVSVRVTARHP